MSKVVAAIRAQRGEFGEEFSFGKKKNEDGTYQDTRYSVPAFRIQLVPIKRNVDAHKKNDVLSSVVGTIK